MSTLKEVKVGQSCTVAKLTGTGAVKRRIMDMGLTKGTEVHVKKVAPLGDPIELPFVDMSSPSVRMKRQVSKSRRSLEE